MRIALSDCKCTRRFIVFAGQKTIYHARRDALGAQHHSHGGGKVFAVAGANIEQKVRERIRPARLHLERVGIVPLQLRLDRFRGIVVVSRLSIHNHRSREIADTPVCG